jgi:hypothetical protein
MKAVICETGGRAATGIVESVLRCLSHLRKTRRRLLQDLISLTKLTHLAFKLFDTRLLGGRLAWPFAAITLDLSHPDARTIRRTAQFAHDRRQRRSFALILIAMLHRHRRFAVSPDRWQEFSPRSDGNPFAFRLTR